MMRLRAARKGAGGSWLSPGSTSCVEIVRVSRTDSPQDVIAWQQRRVEALQGLCRPPAFGESACIPPCSPAADAVVRKSPLAFSHPVLLCTSVSDKARMPDRIETDRRNRINGV